MKVKISLSGQHEEICQSNGRLSRSFKVAKWYKGKDNLPDKGKLVVYFDDKIHVDDIILNNNKLNFEFTGNASNIFTLKYPCIQALFDSSLLSIDGDNHVVLGVH